MAKLSEAAKVIFENQFDIFMACGVYPDTVLLRAYAIARAEMEKAQAAIDADGPVIPTTAGPKESPQLPIRDRALAAVERLSDRLGIDNLPPIPADKPRKTAEAEYSLAEITEALVATHGVVTHAAARLGMNVQGLRNRVQNSALLLMALDDIKNQMKDRAEATVQNCILKGDGNLALKYLEMHAPDRGYSKKVDVSHFHRGQVQHTHAAVATLSDEELDQLEQLQLKISDARESGPASVARGDPGREGATDD